MMASLPVLPAGLSTRRVLLAGTALLLPLYAPQAALAQATAGTEAGQSVTQSGAGEQGLADIVVTATRRNERMQDVPVAVTAIDAKALQANNIRSVDQLRFIAPSLQISPSSFGAAVPGFTIRGQRQQEQLITQDPSVVVYFAEFAMLRPHGTNQGLYDLASVEVLKGPQGTLFGRSTTGGAILINPARPTRDLEGSLAVQLGNYGPWSGTGMLNVPLSNTLQVRAAGRITRRDGYTLNTLTGQRTDDERTENGRLSIRWEPGSGIVSDTVGTLFHENDNGIAFRLLRLRPGSTAANTPGVAASFAREQADPDVHDVENDFAPFAWVKAWSVSNTTTVPLGDATLKNIIGYRSVKTHTGFDYDGTAGTLFHSEDRLNATQFSEELQLYGDTLGGKLSYIGGLYYFREHGRDVQNSILTGTRVNDGEGTNTSYSAYTQLGYHLTDKLKLTGGLRYTIDNRRNIDRNLLNGACRLRTSTGATPSPCELPFDTTFRSPSWLVSLDYKPTDGTLIYLAHRRGYRSGGWNLRANLFREQVPFRPETVYDIELGMKADFLDRRLRINAAVYNQWYKDIQRNVNFLPPLPEPQVLQTVVTNAADAIIKGGELEVTALPVPWLELRGSMAVTDAHYQSWISNGTDLSASEFSQTPEFTASASARVILPVANDGGEASLRFSWYHQTKIAFADNNLTEFGRIAPGYSTFDLSANWDSVGGSAFDISTFMKNIGNKAYIVHGVAVYGTTGMLSAIYGPPRTFGVEVRYHFGPGT